MSTGAECNFIEKTPGRWYYKLQQYPYGYTEEYDEFGPFPTFAIANQHLDENHANPGGYSVQALPGCPHDLRRPNPYSSQYPEDCDRCGASLRSGE
jgi:hypothetical protein